MPRRLLVLVSLLVAGCQLEPGGRCLRDPECLAGQHCSGGVCVSDDETGDVGARCEVERDCAAWTSCSLGRCVLATGACIGNSDCPSWKGCSDHACVPLPGRCSSDAHCASWETCVAAQNRCALRPGACGTDADCAAGERCDASHICVPICASDADCGSWQSCVDGTCATRPANCGDDTECQAPDVCGSDHVCAPPALECRTDGDCDATQVCSLELCVTRAFDGNEVFTWGQLPTGNEAIARLSSPTRSLIAFDLHAGGGFPAWIDPAGDLVYWHGDYMGRKALLRFVPDAWIWDPILEFYLYPYMYEASANDLEIPTPGCAEGPTDWVMHAATGEILYRCEAYSLDYYDTAGALRSSGSRLYAWHANGVLLGRDAGMGLLLRDGSGNDTPVSGFSFTLDTAIITVRSQPAGFWVLVWNRVTDVSERWSIDLAGVATLDGAYVKPSRAVRSDSLTVLDPTGFAYGVVEWADSDWLNRAVVRCGVEPGSCSVVFAEADWANESRVVMIGNMLVTGP